MNTQEYHSVHNLMENKALILHYRYLFFNILSLVNVYNLIVNINMDWIFYSENLR